MDQSNTSLIYGDRLLVKLYRRVYEGTNPEVEMTRFLAEQTSFRNTPRLLATLEYRRDDLPTTLGVLHEFVPDQVNGWRHAVDALSEYIDDVMVRRAEGKRPPRVGGCLLDLSAEHPPELAYEAIGAYLEAAEQLGGRTGELHVALGSARGDPEFEPEVFSLLYQRSLHQSMRTLTRRVSHELRRATDRVPEAVQVLDLEEELLRRYRLIVGAESAGMRIRCHGHYHLEEVLHSGKDFVVVDFEGDPARPSGERRIKRSPLYDVAAMLRSFHYAAYASLFGLTGFARSDDDPSQLEPWILFWYSWVGAAFLRAYLDAPRIAALMPRRRQDLRLLLHLHMLERAVYELGREAEARPAFGRVAVRGLVQLLDEQPVP